MAKDKTKNKNKISDYNLASILLDIVMLFLGLIFFIGTLAGKGDEIASGFVRVVGGVLILVGIFELINFLRIKEKTIFDWIVFIIGHRLCHSHHGNRIHHQSAPDHHDIQLRIRNNHRHLCDHHHRCLCRHIKTCRREILVVLTVVRHCRTRHGHLRHML